MNYRVRIELKEVYDVWVTADSEEDAIRDAFTAFNNGDASVESVIDTMDASIEEYDAQD